jgi:hypothetical protein
LRPTNSDARLEGWIVVPGAARFKDVEDTDAQFEARRCVREHLRPPLIESGILDLRDDRRLRERDAESERHHEPPCADHPPRGGDATHSIIHPPRTA